MNTDKKRVPGQDRLPAVPEKNSTRRESTVINDEADLLIHEKLVAAREDAVLLREGAVQLREGIADTLEREIRAAKTIQTTSDDHMIMLQQANARLVIATVDAQKLAEQLQATQTQLEYAKAVAEKANLAKSDFLSRMSHELRTPLNAILGFAQLLEAGSPPPTAKQTIRLQQITKAGWYLLGLINEILDLTAIESGKGQLLEESVSLAEVTRECQNMIEQQAQRRDIKLTFPQFDIPYFVRADRIRVKQVLINLLSNAIKYNRAHGTVAVECTASPERIRISIKDSGSGLSPENLAQLFQPFNRLGQEAGTEEGTGIGLVITRQLVELMGGEIGVESTVGAGSEFWIELNRDVTPQLAVGKSMLAELAPQAREAATLHTLLYVEDNPANLMLVEHIIEGRHHLRMLSAHDGNLGVALARSHLPDVILMDINLPGISGIEAMNILRKDPATAHIPIIALSANAMPRDIETGLAAGFFRYLTKPIKINELMSVLDDALEFAKNEPPSA
jgi:signal transduction histidine kinase/ActR/RegA family two-component response regulator